MNKLRKPISSPGRTTDKFPPPLMRFLRTNVGNKSRKRSRATPIFFRKKNLLIGNNNQEPSSPKVTCIGQVRVTRSRKNKKRHKNQNRNRNRLCRCFRKVKLGSWSNVWSKWVEFFGCGNCRNSGGLQVSQVVKQTTRDTSIGLPNPSPNATNNTDEEQEQDQDQADNINQGLITRPIPKNALLLTRCRSVPYRSSSLASIFKESTMAKTGEDEVAEELENLKVESESTNGVGEESKAVKASPLILSRCKSEPARRWDQLLV